MRLLALPLIVLALGSFLLAYAWMLMIPPAASTVPGGHDQVLGATIAPIGFLVMGMGFAIAAYLVSRLGAHFRVGTAPRG